MPLINDRPMLMGMRGAIASGHYLATAAGHAIARQGGNAVDIAAAVGFCMTVLEPRELGVGGEVPMLIYSAKERKVFALSGVGWAPKAFSIDWCRQHEADLIPGDGYLPACVPAVVGTWALALQRFGTMGLAQVLAPAIELAEGGFPMYALLHRSLLGSRQWLLANHPTTCEIYLPDGQVPPIGTPIRNGDIAEMFGTLCRAEAAAGKGRIAGIEAARDAFYKGEIAERIIDFITAEPMPDATGTPHTGLLAYEDFAEWRPAVEEPLTLDYRGLEVHKCSSWTQGPVFLQQLAILRGIDLPAMGHNSVEYIHTWLECAKLAFADREAYYGDPLFDEVPFDVLLSEAYAAGRRELIGPAASRELRPGDTGGGVPPYVTFDVRADNRRAMGLPDPPPPPAESHDHDTSHLDVADAEGNLVAATPSGGWIVSSPVVAGLGFPLGTRGQMFYLNADRPGALAPRKRPRATLTPTLVTRSGEPYLAFGTRGGDMQDQHTLQFFLNHVEFGMPIQAALDVPCYHTDHAANSFYPRKGRPGGVVIETRVDPAVVEELSSRGHRITLNRPRNNRMAIRRDPATGVLSAGVCSTGEHAYAMVW